MTTFNNQIKYISLLFITFSFSFSFSFSYCLAGGDTATKTHIYPEIWYPPIYNLPLQKPINQIKSKIDLRYLMISKWHKYNTLNLFDYQTNTKVTQLTNCTDYLTKTIKGAEPVYRHYFFYEAVGLMCEAINTVLHGENSTVSYIGKFTLNRALADKLPIELAFAVSPDSREVVKKNKGKSWTFFDTIKGLKKISPYITKYKIKDATQTISLLARGDFNHDHQEDVLVLVENSIDDGHYNPTRLFTLTRDKGATLFRVIKQYQLRSNVDE